MFRFTAKNRVILSPRHAFYAYINQRVSPAFDDTLNDKVDDYFNDQSSTKPDRLLGTIFENKFTVRKGLFIQPGEPRQFAAEQGRFFSAAKRWNNAIDRTPGPRDTAAGAAEFSILTLSPRLFFASGRLSLIHI